MTTSVIDKEQQPASAESSVDREVPVWVVVLAILGIWVVLWAFTKGTDTLYLPGLERTGFHDWWTDLKADLIAGRADNVLMQITGWFADVFTGVVEWLQGVFVRGEFPRPVPQIGWLGTVALAAWAAYAVSNWKMTLMVVFSFLAFGYLGYWEDSLDTLIIIFFSVTIALMIGLPLAVWVGTSKTATAIVTPILDVLQTMPTFVYLLPLTLFFGLGAAPAVAATVLYAVPPVIRIASHGIRSVSTTTIEATNSMGQTRTQRLTKVQLPMAKRTIIVGVNQTIMAALSMVVIAAFVNGPGLGKPVLQALTANQVGTGFVAGMCIVIMAIMLDRVTTAASERSEAVARGGSVNVRQRRLILSGMGIGSLVAIYLSRNYFWAAEFPESDLGTTIARQVQDFADWFTSTFSSFTTSLQEFTTTWLINPLQQLLAESPWWLTALAFIAISLALGGYKAAISTIVCLAGIRLTGLWYDAMVTLTSVLVATVVVMILAVVLGVWMARRKRADQLLRPILDAGQVLPPFVYLIPALGLFGPSRFTAIVAAVIYAAPPAIKLVADGIRAVSPTTIEAARAAGSSDWQIITKVQLPMAKSSLVLATNQGLLYVLSMVVIGGLVGAGALGYDSVLGFSQGEYFGKGVAAGIAIVLLGIMVDRVARRAAARDRLTVTLPAFLSRPAVATA